MKMGAKPVFTLHFHGVRGSIPVCGADMREFGGATMCIEVRVGSHSLLFDAGSGIRSAVHGLRADAIGTLNLFISHWHYDHVLGLPFFAPLYDSNIDVTIWSGHHDVAPARELLGGLMKPPYFPVTPSVFNARITYRDFVPPLEIHPVPGVTVRTLRLNHPGSATAYRVESGGRSVCIVTDVEHDPGVLDTGVVDFVRDADLMLYDSAYDDDEMGLRCGFGHSSWQQALRIAQAGRVAKVGFIHHAPNRTDADLYLRERAAMDVFTQSFVARQDTTLII